MNKNTERPTRTDAFNQLDESDKEFVKKLNKKDRKKVLDEVNEDVPRKKWGKNYFKRKSHVID